MNFLPALSAWGFAIAGLACAAGPLIIHLLNRRRYRTVHWAAMNFLREAVRRNRRILEVRDLALLALRTLAVLLFGLALARPYLSPDSMLMWGLAFPLLLAGVLAAIFATALWSRALVRFGALTLSLLLLLGAGATIAVQYSRAKQQENLPDASQPVHAVLLVDNSLSMGYQAFAGNLLDSAKEKATEFIERLPNGSRISLVPLCGSQHAVSSDPFRSKEDALEALGRIEVVDRAATIQQAVNAAKKAIEMAPDLSHRVVLLSDQQAANWRGWSPPAQDEKFEMQVVDLSPETWENTWISDLRIDDGLADVETPATITVEVSYANLPQRRDVQVALSIDDVEVAAKVVDLEAGEGVREVPFQYVFNTYRPEPGRPEFVPIKAAITPDQLPADDQRQLIAHVVSELPVVFVDQYRDDQEDRSLQRFGETKELRKLLAPVLNRNETPQHLIAVRHTTVDELDQSMLADARLVVIAGVADPSSAVPLLREYVEQGGQLVIAAGGQFDPARWNDAAWLDGAGILPTPLGPSLIGALPGSAAQLQLRSLSYETMAGHYYFDLATESADELQAIYDEAVFFQVAEALVSPEVVEAFRTAEANRLEAAWENRADDGAGNSVGDRAGDASATLQADWLTWRKGEASFEFAGLGSDDPQRNQALELAVQRGSPRVLARFGGPNGLPYLVERRIGAGHVLLATGGIAAPSTNLHKTKMFFMYDRILRSMVQSTLPQRNFADRDQITLPMSSNDRDVSVSLLRPGSTRPETLDTGFVGRQQRGITINKPLRRGLYRVTLEPRAESADPQRTSPAKAIVFTATGPSGESQLAPLPHDEFDRRIADAGFTWVAPGQPISLTGGTIGGQDAWWYLVLAVLVFLCVELVILAWPQVKNAETSQT